MPGAQERHAEPLRYVPTGHVDAQSDEPDTENVPDAHDTHAVIPALPAYEPALHDEQTLMPDDADTVPAGQLLHEVAPLLSIYVPAVHAVHDDDVRPAYPGPQALHALAPYNTDDDDPGGHA